MGYIAHHAIIVTGSDYGTTEVQEAHKRAEELGMAVSSIVDSPINGYASFFIAPDGSKEGWGASEEGDKRRNEFKTWIRESGRYLDFAEVRFGGDGPWLASMEDHDGQSYEKYMAENYPSNVPCPNCGKKP